MLRFKIIFVCILVALVSAARAGTYALKDGSQVSGKAISYDQKEGIKFEQDGGTYSERIKFELFTQEAIRQLNEDAKPGDKQYLEPYIEELPAEKAQKKEVILKPVTSPERPTKNIGLSAIFSSPVGLMILFILYAATLFAAYEVAVFRNQPIGLVVGLAAIPFLGVCSPIIFIAMPTRTLADMAPVAEALPVETLEAAPVEEQVVEAAPVEAAPALPEPVVFRRGDFSFNRRFFETKLAGFFRLVPSDADKDMVVRIKSARGEFTGRRITKITQDEIYLQTFNGTATADEMIPIIEVMEVQIRHKDLA